ncbi:T9SS type A sorting domain-containing protein [bacterium]|nr:T9SS type A sorting domain-containing protein [bacterium]
MKATQKVNNGYWLAALIFAIIPITAQTQSISWFNTQEGIFNLNSYIMGDTIVSVGSGEAAYGQGYININYANVNTGLRYKTDTFWHSDLPDSIFPNNFIFYPNPASQNFVVSLPNEGETWLYKLYDSTGKLLATGQLRENQNTISAALLTTGIYQISLQNLKTNAYETHTFVIAK